MNDKPVTICSSGSFMLFLLKTKSPRALDNAKLPATTHANTSLICTSISTMFTFGHNTQINNKKNKNVNHKVMQYSHKSEENVFAVD